ncbi:major intrinsically disordered NOTCH2-binding receptor 1-like [Aplochiton taeniatus]
MDISVLPNNNHPDKFLQPLDVGMLPVTHGMFQIGKAPNRAAGAGGGRSTPSPEGSPVVVTDRYLEKHITPVTFTPNVKRNPLFVDVVTLDTGPEHQRTRPSWTVQEYDRQGTHSNLAGYIKEDEKTPKDLDFWLEDQYTPGYDSLLKKEEAQHRKKKLCKILVSIFLSVCAVIVIITVPIVVTRN